MGVKSTYYVTKKFAQAAIQLLLTKADDSQLADALEILLDDDFKNFLVVSEEKLQEEKESGWGRCLDDITQLPIY